MTKALVLAGLSLWVSVCYSVAAANTAESVSVERASAERASLPLTECRLEHPLKVSSVTAHCGTLSVPLDPSGAVKGKLDLHVAVVPALNRRSTSAPLFLLAGGPGQSASDMYVALSGAFARINRDHDIVVLDQRGTGMSSPLACTYPEDWQEPADPMPALRQATQTCLAKFGDRVRFYTTSIAVKDLDAVRAALGYEQIDLYGVSYGTRVAQLYMRRFPTRTHAAILDGVTYPEQIFGPDTPKDGERALQLILGRCRASTDCNTAYPSLQSDLDGLLKQFGAQKVGITLDDPNDGLPKQIDFTRGILGASLRFLSYSATQASILPALIHQAARGTLAPLAAQTIMSARQVGDQLAAGMQYSVLCSEDAPFIAAAEVDRTAMAKTFQGTDQIDAMLEVCKLWPRGPMDADMHSPLHSDVPTLLLSGEADPVTPPADAERAARGLSVKRLLVLSGEGHGQLSVSCVPRLMAIFLNSADPDGLDTTCLQGHSVEPFFVSMSGPSP
jgi:pimeloyl-ACP methyl ester carboxylesterase